MPRATPPPRSGGHRLEFLFGTPSSTTTHNLRANALLDTFRPVIHRCLTMKTATVRDLRNRFARLSAWIENGEPVEITKGGKVFARLLPATEAKPKKLVKVDFLKRLKETWGDRVFSAQEVAEMRAAELEGEQG